MGFTPFGEALLLQPPSISAPQAESVYKRADYKDQTAKYIKKCSCAAGGGECVSAEIFHRERKYSIAGIVFTGYATGCLGDSSRRITESKRNCILARLEPKIYLFCDNRISAGRSFLYQLVKHVCLKFRERKASVRSRGQCCH